jgi:RimJ/RimL family protein N-acetyltransferase
VFPDALDTPRLTFRPLARADAQAIFDTYAQDPLVSQFLTWRPHASVAATEAFIASTEGASATRNYVLIERAGGSLVGSFELRRHSPSRVGYGYLLARPFWGRGLMTEALSAAADWALGQPGVWRIGDVCDVENLASARVMEKAGFVREGLLRRWAVHPNLGEAPRDCFSYARVRDP